MTICFIQILFTQVSRRRSGQKPIPSLIVLIVANDKSVMWFGYSRHVPVTMILTKYFWFHIFAENLASPILAKIENKYIRKMKKLRSKQKEWVIRHVGRFRRPEFMPENTCNEVENQTRDRLVTIQTIPHHYVADWEQISIIEPIMWVLESPRAACDPNEKRIQKNLVGLVRFGRSSAISCELQWVSFNSLKTFRMWDDLRPIFQSISSQYDDTGVHIIAILLLFASPPKFLTRDSSLFFSMDIR
jgi:hypothetical protein